MDAQRDAAGLADVDEIVRLGVVRLDVAVEAARQLRQHELDQLPLTGPAREPARDEDRLIARRHAGPLELLYGGRDRDAPWIVLGTGDREGRRLHDDGRALRCRAAQQV